MWTQGYINLKSNGGNPVTYYSAPPENPNRRIANHLNKLEVKTIKGN